MPRTALEVLDRHSGENLPETPCPSGTSRSLLAAAPPAFETVSAGHYAELKHMLRDSGILKRQPAYHAVKIAATLLMVAFGLFVMLSAEHFYIQLLAAAVLAFAYTQVAFIVHDAGHLQIARSRAWNYLVGVLHCDLLVGGSFSWWVWKHDMHHRSPNKLGHDPDLGLSVLAFTEEQAGHKEGLLRHIVRFQAYFFVLMLLMEAYALRIVSFKYLLKKRTGLSVLEGVLITVHFVVYCWLVFFHMEIWQGLVFVMVHQGLFGFYLGSVFAPNHKGMPVIEADRELEYLHQQVLTARNIGGNVLIDFLYGALNYQIEHHLFPIIPQNRMKQAQVIVSGFCRSRGIAYRKAGMLESYREALSYLHQVSSPLRKKRAPAV